MAATSTDAPLLTGRPANNPVPLPVPPTPEAARPTTDPEDTAMSEQIDIVVHTTGTCPTGHPVTYDMPVTVTRGTSGFATADATCPRHDRPVGLSGRYTT